jgi:hypothetical protein
MARPLAGPLPPHLQQPGANPLAAPAAESLAASPMPQPRPRRPRKLLWGCGLLALAGMGALAAAAAALLLARRPAEPIGIVREGTDEADRVIASDEDALPKGVDWTIGERSIIRAGARVKVLRVEYGEVMARGEDQQPVAAGPGDFVQIYVQIENRADATLHYTSWHGHQFADEGRKVAARLFGADGKRYPQQTFPNVTGIRGHTRQAELARGERAEDVLIFAALREALAPGKTLKLELPAGAFVRRTPGGQRAERGYFRFEVPDLMFAE